jgi:hypothetical protein
MKRNKICPDCGTEYLPHVEKCADCGAVLLLSEEYEKVKEEEERIRQQALDDEVAIREGDLAWISELYSVLIDSGIPCAVRSDPCCGKGCRPAYRLIVSRDDVQRALERIDEYFAEMHPEIRASRELLMEGRCPACGSPVGASDPACSDCGLVLVIEEDGEEKAGD